MWWLANVIISEWVVIRAVLVLILVGVTKQKVSVNLALVRISEVVRMHVDLFARLLGGGGGGGGGGGVAGVIVLERAPS